MSMSKPSSTETVNKDDGLINFRPSPNFKHMKKYLKSKFEEDMNCLERESKLEDNNKVTTLVQPPLPPNSPPPDSPPGLIIKQEVEDNEYEPATEEAPEETLPQQSTPQETDRKKPVMCKDFVRKACTRGSACIYAHEIDFSQLKGVYKFCRDFENSCCNRPICHFVHATTWEKEHFFRTAYLPPHAFAHLKTSTTQPSTNGLPAEVSPVFTNPPPQLQPPSVAVPATTLAGEATQVPAAGAAPLKREWRDRQDFASAPWELDAKEPHAKKCKRCELTELRLQHTKAQVTQAMRSTRELDEKLERMIKKHNRLHGVLRVLLKPRRVLEQVNNNFLTTSRLPAPASLADDDQTLLTQRVLEQVNNNFLTTSRLPASTSLADDDQALLTQMKVLLAKLLLGGEGATEGTAAGS